MRPRVGAIAVAVLGLSSCVPEAEPEQRIYDRGDTGYLVIRNQSRENMAVGGCNPSYYQERVEGAWRLDNLLRPACAFFTDADGNHEIAFAYQFIRPGASIRAPFSTGWISGTEGVIRVLQRVSTGCESPAEAGAPIPCTGFVNLVSDPILIVEPGTAEESEPPMVVGAFEQGGTGEQSGTAAIVTQGEPVRGARIVQEMGTAPVAPPSAMQWPRGR